MAMAKTFILLGVEGKLRTPVTPEHKFSAILPSTHSTSREQVKGPGRLFKALGKAWEAVGCWVRA